MRATFLQCKEKIMRFFQKKIQNQDRFKQLIHRLSEMSDSELTKVEQLLDVVFDTKFNPDRSVEISQSVITDEEQSLDKSIQEAKNKLNTEQLEKRIEQFKQSKKPKKRITHHIWCVIRFLWYNESKYEEVFIYDWRQYQITTSNTRFNTARICENGRYFTQ